MGYILDTQILLWSIFNTSKMSRLSREIVLDRNSRKSISISAMWEISIKNRIGKLPLPSGLSGVLDVVEARGYGIIGIEYQHLEIYNTLPLLHRDPFDGIIIATAVFENMTIITADESIRQYDVPCIW